MIWSWLVRINQRVRPREGWLVLAATLGAVATLPLAMQSISWVPALDRLLPIAVVATLVGFLFARSPFSGRASAFFATILGFEFVVGYIARVLPPFWLTLQETIYAAGWAYDLTQGTVGRAPFLPALAVWGQRAWDFGLRVTIWVQGVMQTGAQQDNLLFLVYSALVLWGMAVWAGWWVLRRRQALIAMIPVGIGLANNLFFARTHENWALSFAALLFTLLIGLRRYTLEDAWSRRKLDYSDEIRVGLYLMGGGISVALLVLMPLVPTIASRRMADMFWDLFSVPWRRVEQTGERMFPELERPAISPLRVGLGGSPDQLPRNHLLGGSPALSQSVALRVRLSQPTPRQGGEKRYYRAVTYADYSGHGWSNEGELQVEEMPPGQSWDDALDTSVGRKRLLQSFTLVNAPGGVLYATGEPVAPDIPYKAQLRAPGDLISLPYLERPDTYSILSAVPAVSEDQLRAATSDYPQIIGERFLALSSIPQRVRDLAAQVTTGAATPYDQALAIESYLRSFEYTLEIKQPPADRDVVDFFLFDLKKGYCDYYASAMVVMARAVGIPARLAVGYSMGTVKEYGDEYTVSEAEAHSWPELYFPLYGWIPFEPTAGRSSFERIGLSESGPTQTTPSADANLQELRRWNPQFRPWLIRFAILAGVLAAIGLGYLGWVQYQHRTWGPVAVAYAGVLWWGKRLGKADSLAETPREYTARLLQRMGQITQASQRGRRRLQRWQEDAAPDLTTIADTYTEERYADRPVTDAQRRQVGVSWRRLRGKLWAFWIARGYRLR